MEKGIVRKLEREWCYFGRKRPRTRRRTTQMLAASIAVLVFSSLPSTMQASLVPTAPFRLSYHETSIRRMVVNRSEYEKRMKRKETTDHRKNTKERVDSIVSQMGLISSPVKREEAGRSKETKESFASNLVSPDNKIPLKTQLEYARNGHACLRGLLEPACLTPLKAALMDHASREALQAWRQKLEVASNSLSLAASCGSILECRKELNRLGVPSLDLPFLQYFNTWRHIPEVKRLAFDLGHAASILMDVPTVRLYQDALFWKRNGDGPTPWHTDARMAPFDTSVMMTFWIPLQSIPKRHGTALVFVPKSHSDFALPFWNDFDGPEYQRLEERYQCQSVDHMPLSLGDVTVHSGWTLHCSDGNPSGDDRLALAISYVDARAEVREGSLQEQSFDDSAGYGDNEDRWSYKEWVEQVPTRQQFRHDLVPIVWPR